jgi:hypothetical protein
VLNVNTAVSWEVGERGLEDLGLTRVFGDGMSGGPEG